MGDGAVVGGESLGGNAALGKCLCVGWEVLVGVAEGEECFADDDVIGAGVVVEFLVPLLHHAALGEGGRWGGNMKIEIY